MPDFGDEVASDAIEGLKETLDAVDGEARAAAKDLVTSYVQGKREERRTSKEEAAGAAGRNETGASSDGSTGNGAEEKERLC